MKESSRYISDHTESDKYMTLEFSGGILKVQKENVCMFIELVLGLAISFYYITNLVKLSSHDIQNDGILAYWIILDCVLISFA